MKVDYKFSNLCGTVYRKGNVVFSASGDRLYSPVGNRVTCFDLKNNKSSTLPFENNCNISKICLCSQKNLLFSIDEVGKCLIYNLLTQTVVDTISFKKKVKCIKFSPSGEFYATTHARGFKVWRAPGITKTFHSTTLLKVLSGAYDETTCLNWSSDSRFIVIGGKDMTVRVYPVFSMEKFKVFSLTGHRSTIINCFFEKDSLNVYSISRDSALSVWTASHNPEELESKYEVRKRKLENDDEESGEEKSDEEDEEEQVSWTLEKKHLFGQEKSAISSAEYHEDKKILVVGHTSGIFQLYEMPDFIQIHSLSISQYKINTVAINASSEWLAFGSAALGQLLVWEWQSETYVLKQQGHFYDMNVMAYSPDGQYIATGGDDGKVKVWNTISGFCFVTFTQHSGGITGVEFSQNGQVILSSSLDGSVRAFDLNRYRNFRTFTGPRPCQFYCLALDNSGEIICAGSLDTFEICMWSLQTGRLLEVLSGHEGPVSCLSFSPAKAILVSGSWDKTVRLWDVYASTSPKDTISIGSDVTAVTHRPDGHEIAVASLDGEIRFWDPDTCRLNGSIEGRRDLLVGRRKNDLVSSKQLMSRRCFTSLCYSADGHHLLAGGKSRHVCIYHIRQEIMLRRFNISNNMSLDGMQVFKHSKRGMTEAGPIDLMDLDNRSDDEDGDKSQIALPGVKKGDMSSRRVQPEVQTKALRFSPAGRSWAAATTEGLLIFSLDGSVAFQPEGLDLDITPEKILELSNHKEHSNALNYAFRLNEQKYMIRVIENIKIDDVSTLVQGVPRMFLSKLLEFVGKQLENSPHVQFYLAWCKHILSCHGGYIKSHSRSYLPTLRLIQKNLVRHSSSLTSLCDSNTYTLKYLTSIPLQSSTDAEVELMETE